MAVVNLLDLRENFVYSGNPRTVSDSVYSWPYKTNITDLFIFTRCEMNIILFLTNVIFQPTDIYVKYYNIIAIDLDKISCNLVCIYFFFQYQ